YRYRLRLLTLCRRLTVRFRAIYQIAQLLCHFGVTLPGRLSGHLQRDRIEALFVTLRVTSNERFYVIRGRHLCTASLLIRQASTLLDCRPCARKLPFWQLQLTQFLHGRESGVDALEAVPSSKCSKRPSRNDLPVDHLGDKA